MANYATNDNLGTVKLDFDNFQSQQTVINTRNELKLKELTDEIYELRADKLRRDQELDDKIHTALSDISTLTTDNENTKTILNNILGTLKSITTKNEVSTVATSGLSNVGSIDRFDTNDDFDALKGDSEGFNLHPSITGRPVDFIVIGNSREPTFKILTTSRENNLSILDPISFTNTSITLSIGVPGAIAENSNNLYVIESTGRQYGIQMLDIKDNYHSVLKWSFDAQYGSADSIVALKDEIYVADGKDKKIVVYKVSEETVTVVKFIRIPDDIGASPKIFMDITRGNPPRFVIGDKLSSKLYISSSINEDAAWSKVVIPDTSFKPVHFSTEVLLSIACDKSFIYVLYGSAINADYTYIRIFNLKGVYQRIVRAPLDTHIIKSNPEGGLWGLTETQIAHINV